MMRPLLRAVTALSAATMASFALAHGFLDRALPAANSVVHTSPPQIRLWFTQRLEPAFSRVRVLDRGGRQVDNGDAMVDGADPTLIAVSVPKLAPGRYRVTWRVVSVDTHVSEGRFTFDVAP